VRNSSNKGAFLRWRLPPEVETFTGLPPLLSFARSAANAFSLQQNAMCVPSLSC
jgi:hypothetical protein